MKTITLLTSGTHGDVLPYLALGSGLQQAGHNVRIAAPVGFRSVIEPSGLCFAPFDGNPSDLMIEQGDPLTFGRNLIHSIRANRDFIAGARSLYPRMLHSAAESCRGSDVLVYGLATLWGAHIAEGLRIPGIRAVLQPLAPTHRFSSALLPFRFSFGIGNWLTHWLVMQVTWRAWRREIDRSRHTEFDLPPAHWLDPSLRPFSAQPLTLNGFSELVVPRPSDWNEKQVITGYWRSPAPKWTPPDGLERFIEHSPQNTIAIGFGSPGAKNFMHILSMLEEALRNSEARAVLTIPEKWHPHIQSERICAVRYAPHEWLYRRVRVAVHHGGAGTTSASLHAGIPTIMLPLAIDQFFWGERIHRIGVGSKPIPQRSLTAKKLTVEIQHCLNDKDLREQAESIGAALGLENGVQAAVRAIREVV